MNKWQRFGQMGAAARWSKYNKDIHNFLKNKFMVNFKTMVKLAQICGVLAGDGSVRIRKNTNYEICVYPDDLNVAKLFQQNFRAVYGKTIRIENKNWSGNCYVLRTKFKKACLHLLSIGSFGIHWWSIPKFVYTHKKLKITWLKSFFDSEAYVNPNGQIQVQSVNDKGITQVKRLLKSIGIDSKIYTYRRKNKNWSLNYILCIMGKNIRKYLKLVGFNHTKKIINLNQIVASRRGRIR